MNLTTSLVERELAVDHLVFADLDYDLLVQFEVPFADKADCCATFTHASRASDSVDIFLDVLGHVVVDDVRDRRDI